MRDKLNAVAASSMSALVTHRGRLTKSRSASLPTSLHTMACLRTYQEEVEADATAAAGPPALDEEQVGLHARQLPVVDQVRVLPLHRPLRGPLEPVYASVTPVS